VSLDESLSQWWGQAIEQRGGHFGRRRNTLAIHRNARLVVTTMDVRFVRAGDGGGKELAPMGER